VAAATGPKKPVKKMKEYAEVFKGFILQGKPRSVQGG